MIGKILCFIALVAVAAAAAVAREWVEKPYEGVDPNSISCDPFAKELLLLPHFSNCSQFYMCVHGNEVEFDCAPGGLVFDFERQTCNWGWAIPCELRKVKVEEGSGDDEEEFVNFDERIENSRFGDNAKAKENVRPVAGTLSVHLTNNAVPLDCARALSAEKRTAYKGDCQRYWKCVEGLARTAFCSDGLYFNGASMQCDHESNVHCSEQITDELNGEYMIYE